MRGIRRYRFRLFHTQLEERKTYWRDTEKKGIGLWSDWQADSLADAQDVESYFINKGMTGGTGGNLDSRRTVYVYVF